MRRRRQDYTQSTRSARGAGSRQHRRFLHRLMPELESWFHYRNLDVSTLKVLASHWTPDSLKDYDKENRHEVLSDIRESIAELRYYRQFMGEFGGKFSQYDTLVRLSSFPLFLPDGFPFVMATMTYRTFTST